MTSNFIFLLFAFNTAISRHLCVCQPDRPGPVCTLNQKCRNFMNENQILLIQKNNQLKNTSEVNIFQIFQDIRKEGHTKIDLELDVFGSFKARPIIFDFTEAEKFINFDNDLHLSITIRGGEWKQIVNLTGFNSTSSNIWSKLSLSLQDISVLFDINNTSPLALNSEPSLYFDSFEIKKSRLIVPPGKYATFNAHNLHTDTISSYSDFNGKIIVDHLSYTDTDDPKIINNFFSPFHLINKTTFFANKKTDKKKKTVLEAETSSSIGQFSYSFCLSTKERLDRSLESLECDMHSVSADLDHYINVKSTNAMDIIKKAPNGTTIRFYLTEASASDPCSLVLPNFDGHNLKIFFQVADPDIPTYLNLKSSDLNYAESYSKNNTISFQSVQKFNIDTELLSTFANVTLKLSQMSFADSRVNGSVRNLITDSDSISSFEGVLYVQESIELRRTTPKRMVGSIVLQDNSQLIVPQISNFPHILFKRKNANLGENLPQFYISLADALEYIDMRFYITEYRTSLFFSDDLLTITDVINLTFRCDVRNYDRDNFEKSPYIFFTTKVPANGLNITFGDPQSDDEIQWPRKTVFYFDSMINSSAPITDYPLVYLSIYDAEYIKDEATANKSVFMIFRYVSIYVSGIPSFHPFADGVNHKHKECPIDLPFQNPFSQTSEPNRCYQVNGFNLGIVTLDIGDDLVGVKFEDKKTYLNATTAGEIKVPDIFSLIILITSSNAVTYDIRGESHDITKTQKFNLLSRIPIDVTFTDAFINKYENYYQLNSTLTFSHQERDINFITSGQPVPYVFCDDQVQGVHYNTIQGGGIHIITITPDYFQKQSGNTREGPNLRVEYSTSVDIPQAAFLADQVNFRNINQSPVNVNFYYWNVSVADYLFEGTNLNIRSKNSWPYKSVVLSDSSTSSSLDFKAKSITFDSRSRVNRVDPVNLNMEVDRLSISSINSLPSSSFLGPIVAHESVYITDNNINRIIFSADSVQVFSTTLSEGTAIIRLIPRTSSSSSSPTPSSSHLLEDEEDDVPLNSRDISANGITISTGSKEPIDLVVNGSTVPDNFKLELTGNDQEVVLDKSWNNVQVPDDFTIDPLNGKYKIDTDLVELPSNLQSTGATVTHRKQKLTKDVGFIIFIVIFAVVFVIAIILCIYGLTCFPQEEAYDISDQADGADLIEDDDTDIDRSTDYEEQEKIKKQNDDMGPREEVESVSSGVVIEQQPSNGSESDTDSNFFDDADNETEKNKVK